MKKVGLALGGGGARGLAHVRVLELLDEMGVRVHCIAGTSMGSIMGALYASGLTGKEIRQHINRLRIMPEDSWQEIIDKRRDLMKWFEVLVPAFSRTGLIRTDKLIDFLYELIQCNRFEDLEIPLLVVAADYWTNEEVVYDKGPLLPPIRASMAIPGVFPPVKIEDHVLIDGGVVNLVPYDLLPDECDVTIAVDVSGTISPTKRDVPDMFDSVLHSFEIAQESVHRAKMLHEPPDIYVRPGIQNVEILAFDKIDEIYRHTKPSLKRLREELEQRL